MKANVYKPLLAEGLLLKKTLSRLDRSTTIEFSHQIIQQNLTFGLKKVKPAVN